MSVCDYQNEARLGIAWFLFHKLYFSTVTLNMIRITTRCVVVQYLIPNMIK